MKKISYKRIINILFREFPLYYISRIFNFLPNNIVTCKLRGRFVKVFFYRCGKNFQLAQGSILNYPEKMIVGDNVYIAHRAYINANNWLYLGDNITIGPNVIIATSNHNVINGKVENNGTAGKIKIGSGTWVGGQVTITDNVSIGKNCIIGAGAVVTKDVPDGAFATGVPARIRDKKKL